MVRKSNGSSNSAGAPTVVRARPRGRGAAAPDRRGRRALAVRQIILRAAARAFRRRGFAETGMREIAAEADLSPGNLYYYFGSKDELLYFCQDHSLDRMLATCREVGASRAGAADRLARVIRAHLACMLDELDGAAAHTEVQALPPLLRARIVAKRDRYEATIRRIVAEGVRSGTFAPCDPTLVTRAVLGALNWTARWYRPDGGQPPAAVADAFANYLVRGLTK
ncbi:MAG TPA: TetR/AcrR family transcriptional regulator [Gemmatimonadales bacterium]|nr:TetR/AcrR family transcriptional regulator [Gemmatimonadales bacterium]